MEAEEEMEEARKAALGSTNTEKKAGNFSLLYFSSGCSSDYAKPKKNQQFLISSAHF